MKVKFLIGILFFAFCGIAKSQTSISTSTKKVCSWNVSESKFDDCNSENSASLFVVNSSETMITHTTNEIKSTYYVKEKKYSEEYKQFEYKVVSDVGNEYTFYISLDNKLLKILSMNSENIYCIIYSIKAVF